MKSNHEKTSAEIIVLRAELDHTRRKRRFERSWLQRHHPEIFAGMEKASAKNDDDYRTAQMKKFSDGLSKNYNL